MTKIILSKRGAFKSTEERRFDRVSRALGGQLRGNTYERRSGMSELLFFFGPRSRADYFESLMRNHFNANHVDGEVSRMEVG